MYAHATWTTCGLCGTALVPTQRNSPSSCASSDSVRLLAIAAKRDAAKRECSRSSLATCNNTSRTVQAMKKKKKTDEKKKKLEKPCKVYGV